MQTHLGLSTPLAVLDLLLIAGKKPQSNLVKMARRDFARCPERATLRVINYLDRLGG